MTRAVWDKLLAEAEKAHVGPLAAFCAFPDDLHPVDVTPRHIPAATLFEDDQTVQGHPLGDAFQAASPAAFWRETWKGSKIGADFVDQFACFALIGNGGAFSSAQMGAFVVYIPPGLTYPRHHHPAEELYVILAGQAEFHRDGEAPETLGPGDTSQHQANQPHATITGDQALLAYVLWRNHFGTPPIWTEEALR